MNFQQLEYIIAVDRLKNFSKAAIYCHVTQATISTMIKKLEEELGVILFDRISNPVITTDIGEMLVSEARSIIRQATILKELAKGSYQTIEGKIKIGVIPTIANSLLPIIIKPILSTYDKLKVEVFEMTSESIIKQLKEGYIDVGIMATPINNEEIEEEVLYYEALMVYGDIGDSKQYIMPEEIKQHKIWLLEEGHCIRDQFINLCALKKNEDVPHNFSFDASSFDTLLAMVDEFDGLTLIPELYYRTLPDEQQKKVSFFNTPIPVREVSMVFYRPFAKLRIIQAITVIIKNIVNDILISNKYKKSELSIARI